MSGSGFVKLYGTILTSSIWLENDSTLRVWIAMLATADESGYVGASVGGLAHVSRVNRKRCEEALSVLAAPDPDSRTEDHEGRRIQKADGGWLILNHQKYRDLRTSAQIAEAERKAAYRARDKSGTSPDSPALSRQSTEIQTDGEADGEEAEVADKEIATSPSSAREADLATEITGLLNVSPSLVSRWRSMLEGMTKGMGTRGMVAVPWDTLREAAVELSTAGGDATAHRYKAFVQKVLTRDHPRVTGTPRPPNGDKASRSVQALSTWLADSEIPDAEVIENGEQ